MEEAVQCFSYPQVVPGYTEVILSALLKHTEYPNAAQLAVLFVESTKPVLDTPEKMTMYMDALILTDIDSAFKYQVPSPLTLRPISLLDGANGREPPLKASGNNYSQISLLQR